MMLTAIPTNPNSSVYAHNHTPSGGTPASSSPSSSQPDSPDPASRSSNHVLCGMDSAPPPSCGSSSSGHHEESKQGPLPSVPHQVIPIHQPFFLGTGSNSYTIIPSFPQQQVGAVSALPTHTGGGFSAAVPLSYYHGRLPVNSSQPIGFQQQLTTANPLQSRYLSVVRPPQSQLTTRSILHPSSSSPPPPADSILISGIRQPGLISDPSAPNPSMESKTILQQQQGSLSGSDLEANIRSSMINTSSVHRQHSQNDGLPPSSLEKGTSSSDPDIHQSVGQHCGDPLEQRLLRKRKSHDSYSRSRTVRHVSQSSSTVPEDSPPSSIRVKCEPLGDDPSPVHPGTTARRNSDSNIEETGLSSKSYQINALIDVPPMAPPLNRASRTSSLSSSLSSFRFGGSLSQLWASQISLSGRINNMKSTGNLNAETGVMPSLGNQYFAFGGSLPELSLTSLTRLLPNSSSNDPSSLLTLPLYVYPSQQHLPTPFINSHGSITFGSFLSSGSSLCSTSKGATGAGSSTSSIGDRPASTDNNPTTSSSTNHNNVTHSTCTAAEERLSAGAVVSSSSSSPPTSSPSTLQESVIKLPSMYSLPRTLLGGAAPTGVITSLPTTFSLIPGTTMQSNVSSSDSHSNMASSLPPPPPPLLPPSMTQPSSSLTLDSLRHQPHISTTSSNNTRLHPHNSGDHTSHPVHPHHLPLHGTTPHSHLQQKQTPPNCSSEGYPHSTSPSHSDLYLTRGDTPAILHTMPIANINRVKLERDLDAGLQDMSPHDLSLVSPEAQLHSPHHNNSSGNSSTGELVGGNRGVKKEREKPYQCDHPGCSRSFSFPAHLRSHIQQIHISYRPCKCEFPGCGKRFYTPQHLNVHRRVHTGERPFVCPYTECSKAFTTAGNLKNHIRTHTGERPYACKFEACSKRFAEMSSLKKHELTHTGEKPYKCRVCAKAFSQAGSRNTHERKHNRTDDKESMVGMMAPPGRGTKKYRIKRISDEALDPGHMEQ